MNDNDFDDESISIIREQVESRVKRENNSIGEEKDSSPINSQFINECLYAEEKGDGDLYAELNRGRFLYVANSCEWMLWTGNHWELDVTSRSLNAVEDIVSCYIDENRRLAKLADKKLKAGDDDGVKQLEKQRKAIHKRIQALRKRRRRENVLHFAATCSDPITIRGDEVDQKPWLLPCANGVIDLQTGAVRGGRPKDYLLKASPVHWDGINANRSLWNKALLEIMNDDEEMVEFLQRLFGLAIIGKPVEDILPVLTGAGSNGKTKILVAKVRAALGPLAGPIPTELLLDQGKFRNSAGPSPDIMKLRGLRIGFGVETDEHRYFSPSRVKWLTGADELTGRNPHDRYFVDFQPTHTIFLVTNHKPHAPSNDFAFWRRVLLVPFPVRFTDKKDFKLLGDLTDDVVKPADKHLPERLDAELPGILAWLVEGCLKYQKYGLSIPAEILEATQKYQRDEDLLHDFIVECCHLGAGLCAGSSELFAAFHAWYVETNGVQSKLSQKKFGQLLRLRFKDGRDGSGRVKYEGIGLNDMGQVLKERALAK